MTLRQNLHLLSWFHQYHAEFSLLKLKPMSRGFSTVPHSWLEQWHWKSSVAWLREHLCSAPSIHSCWRRLIGFAGKAVKRGGVSWIHRSGNAVSLAVTLTTILVLKEKSQSHTNCVCPRMQEKQVNMSKWFRRWLQLRWHSMLLNSLENPSLS